MTKHAYHLPTIPYSPEDLVARASAATGTCANAALTHGSDFNGHALRCGWYPQTLSGACWRSHYIWSGINRVARGSLSANVSVLLERYNAPNVARGTSVEIVLDDTAPEPIEEQVAIVETAGFKPGPVPPMNESPWWTGRHEAVLDSILWAKHMGPQIIQHALEYQGDVEGWPAAREAFLDARRDAKLRHR